jgi:hypothetical protein
MRRRVPNVGRRPAFEWLRRCEQARAIQPRKRRQSRTRDLLGQLMFLGLRTFCARGTARTLSPWLLR